MPTKLFQDLPGTAIPNGDYDSDDDSALGALRARTDLLVDVITESKAYSALSQWWGVAKGRGIQLGHLAGSAAWILATSALVVVIPLVYEIDRELGDSPPDGAAPPDPSPNEPSKA